MSDSNSPLSSVPVNARHRNGRSPKTMHRDERTALRLSCTKCGWANYPNTGRCSNQECSLHRDRSGDTSPSIPNGRPTLFHGRKWGDWVLDTKRFVLVLRGYYEVDLETVSDSAACLDWIYQVPDWGGSKTRSDIVTAFGCIFDPQANLCSGGRGKTISNLRQFLENRFATVGKGKRSTAFKA